MRVRINLDTLRDVNDFVRTCSCIGANVYITDNAGLCVSAKSILGAMYALEFNELWCECNEDIYRHIERFVVL